ncbi:MAG: GNAT family N-acetyltransferase, partial [Pseudomonadota bacterium]
MEQGKVIWPVALSGEQSGGLTRTMSGLVGNPAMHSRDAVWRTVPLTGEHLHSILPQWRDLWQKAGERNFFLSPDFLLPSLPLLASKRPMLVTAFRGESLIGLMVMRGDIGYAKLPIGFWRSALHAEQYLGTPLVMKGEEGTFAKGLCEWLDRSDSSRCFVKIAYISADCDLANAIKGFCANDERVSFEQGRHARAAISPASDDVEFDAHLSANRRRSLRKARRKLESLGAVDIESLTKADALSDWIDDFLKLENSGWKGAEGSSILSNPDETELYRSIIRAAFDIGGLHFSRLCIDSKPIAYTLDIRAVPFAFCLKSA